MTPAAILLFSAAAGLAAWSYLVYPVVLRRLAARATAPADSTEPAARTAPSVEVLIAAANEEPVIAERVRNLLEQESPGPLRIAVGCDGSTDATAARARSAGDPRVEVTEFPSRRGKASVLNDLVAASRADVLVFTDANTRFEPGAVGALCRALAPSSVGAACGRLVLESTNPREAGRTAPEAGRASPEARFWDRETRWKELEGKLGTCLGANGAIYAAWRSSVPRLAADTTSMDDFLIPLGILRRGEDVVFAPDAVAREAAGRDPRAEASRRFRIGVGAGQVLRRERWIWTFRARPLVRFLFFSRKAARWLAPVFALAAAGAALASSSEPLRWTGAILLALAALVLLASRMGLRARGPVGPLYYFAVLNLSLAAGVVAGLIGYSRPAWKSQR